MFVVKEDNGVAEGGCVQVRGQRVLGFSGIVE